MELKKEVQDKLNEQIVNEFHAGYLYLSMAAWFETKNLNGFSHWMKKQASEENEHAMKIFSYVNSRGGKVTLGQIDKPKSEWKSPLEAVEDALAHERKVTELINKLADLADKNNDKATRVMLNWFITEQVEEEEHSSEIVEMLKMVKDSTNGLMMLDHKLGSRK